MKFTISQLGMALAVLVSIPALAEAQGNQQYGQQTGPQSSWEYNSQRSSLPNGTAIDVQYVVTGLPNVNWGASITQAAAVWNAAGANVRLVTTPAPTVININFVTTGQPMTITVNTVNGSGTYPDGRSWNQITSATIDIHDAGASFNDDPSVLPGATQRDALSWLIRAFGFALGLGVAGAGDPASVMLAGNPPDGAADRTLSAQDILALQTIYGSPEPATWALFGVGLASLGALRRRRKA